MPDDGARNEIAWRESLLRGVMRRGPSLAGHAARITIWGVVHFAFVLTQQIAELVAPLFLVLGIGWYALPRAIGLIQTNDGQMHDILNGLVDRIPSVLEVAGHSFTPVGLIVDGVILMAIAAGLSTATALLANELYRDRP
jgi:hypothetical protein